MNDSMEAAGSTLGDVAMATPAELAIEQQRLAVGDDLQSLAVGERFDRFERPAHRLGRIEPTQVERPERFGMVGHGFALTALAARAA
jgi:hypothetical protein